MDSSNDAAIVHSLYRYSPPKEFSSISCRTRGDFKCGKWRNAAGRCRMVSTWNGKIKSLTQGLQATAVRYSQATPKDELTNGKRFTFNHDTRPIIACQTIRLDLVDLLE
ncbi:unnamed protein product [Dovyalis caffra]|uniref:Uncharacterized protein n=1 Tax=Dovyalis caffra TaxID=77055 RepID=A0AAV1QZN1_9ROSI|nr:unnamed protein product [Dovyalis caffra]